jgi:hypothetical protein
MRQIARVASSSSCALPLRHRELGPFALADQEVAEKLDALLECVEAGDPNILRLEEDVPRSENPLGFALDLVHDRAAQDVADHGRVVNVESAGEAGQHADASHLHPARYLRAVEAGIEQNVANDRLIRGWFHGFTPLFLVGSQSGSVLCPLYGGHISGVWSKSKHVAGVTALQLVDLALRPFMHSWVRGVFRTLSDVPRPTDDPRVHASGANSDRILLFGSGAAVGWGVLSHDMALPGSLARATSALTGRGTDVEVVAAPEFRAATAIRALGGVDLARYDAIVLTLGLNEAVRLTSVSAWRRDMEELLTHIGNAASPRTPIFLLGIHAMTQITRYDSMLAPIVARHRTALNRVSARIAAHRARVTFVPFSPPPRSQLNRYRSTSEYREGGRYLAARVAPVLDEPINTPGVARRSRNVPLDALARRNVLDALWSLDGSTEQRYDRLTEFARRSFHVSKATITIVEGDRFWTKSSQGGSLTTGSRDNSICFTTIEQEDALVVSDAARDPRFFGMSNVVGSPQVRFYAGHRIEAPNGVPIGVLCIHDSVARDVRGFDRALLRDIALLVQKEIWLAAREYGVVPRRPIRGPVAPVARTYAPAISVPWGTDPPG